MSRFFQRSVLALSVAILVALGSGLLVGKHGFFGVHASSDQDGAYKQTRVYAEVLKRIQTDYVTDPNIDNVTTGALHGLLESLDADSSYLTPTEYKLFRARPADATAQVGITVSKRYGYAIIVNVLVGSPADKLHLEDGDVIESIGERSTRDMSLAAIRFLLEGKPGTDLVLSVVRPRKGDPEKITLTRTAAALPDVVEQQYENATILYLRPGTLTAPRVDAIAAKIKADGKNRKLLLDLRDSSSSDLQQGLRLANLFLKSGAMGTLEGQKHPKQTFTADASQCITNSPLVVLVNRGTYGAAELTAAAIEGAKRGDVVGERTFGEGSVQKTIELPDGSALILTVAKYAGPNGKKIQDEAVIPNVTYEQTPGNEDNDTSPTPSNKSDDFLNRALGLLKSKTV